jgi:predicted TIM-barrel fold metal-dependent hydrolase
MSWQNIQKIDSHVHVTFAMPESSDIRENTPEKYLQKMEKNNIVKAIVVPINFPYYHAIRDGKHDYLTALKINNDIQASIANQSERFICFADVYFHKSFDQKLVFTELDRAFTKLNLSGLKIHCSNMLIRANDKIILELIKYSKTNNIPVIFHSNPERNSRYYDDYSHPLLIEDALRKIDYDRVLISHMGGEEFQFLERINCFFDISFAGNRLWKSISSGKFANDIRKIGIEKCCFGTDYPIHQYSTYYSKLDKCYFSTDEISKISLENISNFLQD